MNQNSEPSVRCKVKYSLHLEYLYRYWSIPLKLIRNPLERRLQYHLSKIDFREWRLRDHLNSEEVQFWANNLYLF